MLENSVFRVLEADEGVLFSDALEIHFVSISLEIACQPYTLPVIHY
jgi:hypothetical protein